MVLGYLASFDGMNPALVLDCMYLLHVSWCSLDGVSW